MEDLKSVAKEYRQTKKKKKSDKVWSEGINEFKAGKMHSGKGGKVVTSEAQAKAIIMSKLKRGKR